MQLAPLFTGSFHDFSLSRYTHAEGERMF